MQGIIDTLKADQAESAALNAPTPPANTAPVPIASAKKKLSLRVKTLKESKEATEPKEAKQPSNKGDKQAETFQWINPPPFRFFPTAAILTNLILKATNEKA